MGKSKMKAVIVLFLLMALVTHDLGKEVITKEASANVQKLLSASTEVAVRQDEDPRNAVQANYGKIMRTCMNTCGGLCRQLCHKFKHIKVCNGCVRGCDKRCMLKNEILVEKERAKMDEIFSRKVPYGKGPKVQNH